jgi:hypothetical protein
VIVHGPDCKEKNSWIRGEKMFVHGTDYKSASTSHNKEKYSSTKFQYRTCYAAPKQKFLNKTICASVAKISQESKVFVHKNSEKTENSWIGGEKMFVLGTDCKSALTSGNKKKYSSTKFQYRPCYAAPKQKFSNKTICASVAKISQEPKVSFTKSFRKKQKIRGFVAKKCLCSARITNPHQRAAKYDLQSAR